MKLYKNLFKALAALSAAEYAVAYWGVTVDVRITAICLLFMAAGWIAFGAALLDYLNEGQFKLSKEEKRLRREERKAYEERRTEHNGNVMDHVATSDKTLKAGERLEAAKALLDGCFMREV